MDEFMNVSNAKLVHFDGSWDASERKQVATIIQKVERELDLTIPDELPFGAPWLVAVTDWASSERRFTAHRQDHSKVLSATSLVELVEQIRALPSNAPLTDREVLPSFRVDKQVDKLEGRAVE